MSRRLKRSPAVLPALCLAPILLAACGYFDPLHPPVQPPLDTSVSWQKSIGGAGVDCAMSVLQTADGGFALTGYTNSFGAGGYDLWFVRTDASGNLMWQKAYGGAGDEKGYCGIQTDDGGFVLAGSATSFGAGEEDMYLVKIDADGNEQWHRTFPGTQWAEARSVIQTSDDGFAIAGLAYSAAQDNTDGYVVKTDRQGLVVQWSKVFGDIHEDRVHCIIPASDGGYAMAGLSEGTFLGDDNAWFLKTDADGNQIQSRMYGIEFLDSANWIAMAPDGGYAIAGYTRSWAPGISTPG